jgi:hypothetical protein
MISKKDKFLLLLEFLFGTTSILYLQVQKVTAHLKKYEHEYEYDDCIHSQHWFIAKFLSFIDRIQLFLESCSTAPAVPNISFHQINFDTVLQSIINGTFTMTLPTIIQNALLDNTKKTNYANGKKNARKRMMSHLPSAHHPPEGYLP